MNINLEIRKLPLAEKSRIVEYLEEEESWKKLMSIIPSTLTEDYRSDISLNNPPKYRSEHFHIIQNASNLTKRFCSEILLREWATAGRIRPALGHLKYLLEKAQLFHAADFVTVDLLKQQKTRPTKGPGVKFYKEHFSIAHKLFAQNSSTGPPDYVPYLQKLWKCFLVSQKNI